MPIEAQNILSKKEIHRSFFSKKEELNFDRV